jgi:hypothetical protein
MQLPKMITVICHPIIPINIPKSRTPPVIFFSFYFLTHRPNGRETTFGPSKQSGVLLIKNALFPHRDLGACALVGWARHRL